MAPLPKWYTCPVCQRANQQPSRGRRRVYCDDACQQEAYRRRRSGGRVVEGTGLLNQQGPSLVGSNPTLSATTSERVYDEWERPQPQRRRVAEGKTLNELELLASGVIRKGMP